MEKLTVYGAPLSPFVRKIRLALGFKGVPFELVPVIPMAGAPKPAEFEQNSPLGKIPLLRVGDDYISDSAVMCAWLEREVPQPALLPQDNLQAARALWFQEYADSQMVPPIGSHLFAEVVLAEAVFKREPIQSDIDLALNEEIPAILNYLEAEIAGDYLLGADLTLADITVGSLVISLQHCQYQVDGDRWPKMAAYFERLLANPVYANALEEERAFMAALAG